MSDLWEPEDRWEDELAASLATHLEPGAVDRWNDEVHDWIAADSTVSIFTILEPEYPAALRLVFNPPPFITIRGALVGSDARGIAVVGTRKATRAGLQRAYSLGRALAEASVTVYSGLARGIDGAAHQGALDGGGRTVAVLGHGLLRPTYPPEHASLARAVMLHGAVISQFRPPQPPTRSTFPMRNLVMSGLAQATAVVEAGETSGARMQARLAAEHGRRVWLLSELVERFSWASAFAERYSAYVRVVDDVGEVLAELRDPEEISAAAAGPLPPVSEAEVRRRPPSPPRPLFTA